MAEPNVNPTVTSLLAEVRRGDPSALSRLFAVVYDKLLEIARIQRRRQPSTETLNTTALVHEAFIKLVGSESLDFNDRAHFMAVAATAMRQILIGHARRKSAAKRGAGQEPASFEEVERALETEAGFVTEKADALLAPRQDRGMPILRGDVDRRDSGRARRFAGHRKARLGDGPGVAPSRNGEG